jgi:hypothetical protein
MTWEQRRARHFNEERHSAPTQVSAPVGATSYETPQQIERRLRVERARAAALATDAAERRADDDHFKFGTPMGRLLNKELFV